MQELVPQNFCKRPICKNFVTQEFGAIQYIYLLYWTHDQYYSSKNEQH